ncbi:Ferredoxin Fd1, Fd2 [Giardia muris]|uniref:Ferredoxin Fd1, Fd2 n=1 Tax=Giardia muris TaxID=5742 RepID=A0A4Z1SLI7_GIAMU|nr:Ferredoxin Fd1, Fd2 [Giardia muris]|eukprot:TNJ26516.1 Ferredoxin Fd1, Fd2 [Giardia muris]
MPVILDASKCCAMMECCEACPVDVFDFPPGSKVILVARPDACIECGQCVAACPSNALSL